MKVFGDKIAGWLCYGVMFLSASSVMAAAMTTYAVSRLEANMLEGVKNYEQSVVNGSRKDGRKCVERHIDNSFERNLTNAEINNNPLNVKGTGWDGQYDVDEFGHARFTSPAYGVRAAANVLITYNMKYGIDTIDGIVNRFCESNKREYAASIFRRTGIKPDEKIDVIAMLPVILEAMSYFETGKVWPYELFAPYSLIKTAFVKASARRS